MLTLKSQHLPYRGSVEIAVLAMKSAAEQDLLARRRRRRRKLRTGLLGAVATVALFWGAIDIVGVPVEHLLNALKVVAIGVLLTMALALLPAALLIYRRTKRRK